MKYAIAHVCDQTICYVKVDGVGTTTEHPKAGLWEDVAVASNICVRLSVEQALFLKNGGDPRWPVSFTDEQILERFGHWLEAVEDENEFRTREDTW